jgi:hypothetical protein
LLTLAVAKSTKGGNTMPKKMGKKIWAYKCTRENGTDFRTGEVNYARALKNKKPIEVLNAGPSNGLVCGHGIHTSPTAINTIHFSDKNFKPWRWFKGWFYEEDLIEQNKYKNRSRRFHPTKELYLKDVFGNVLLKKCQRIEEETRTWKDIPWLEPPQKVTKKRVEELVKQWIEALQPYLAGKKLPRKVRIATTVSEITEISDRTFFIDIKGKYRAINRAVDTAIYIADTTTEIPTIAALDAVESATNALNNSGRATDKSTIEDIVKQCRIFEWYTQPWNVLQRFIKWEIAGVEGANPFEPFLQLYKMGCAPMGYTTDGLIVYVPANKERKKIND